VVVFCVFVHDLDSVARSAAKAKRMAFEVSGRWNELNAWKRNPGAVLAVQIQAGSEGIDMTNAHYAIYYSLPHSLAQYNQSKARLYRPGQRHPVSFCHLLAEGTVDEAMYNSLQKKQDVVEAIKSGQFDFGYIK
jgi:SNF2 family DNA or RNA helicase